MPPIISILSPVRVDNTLGAALIGFAVSCMVFGIIVTQAFIYIQRYPADQAIYKFVVCSLLIIATADQSFIGRAVYLYAITNYANPLVLIGAPPWYLILTPLLGAVAGTIVKLCFAVRIWRFSKGNYFITGVIMLLIVSQLGLAVVYTTQTFFVQSIISLSDFGLKILGCSALGVGVLNDILIAVAFCYFLQKWQNGYRRTNIVIRRLMKYAVETGALTSLFSLSTVILYIINPDNFIFMSVYFILSKLYAVSLLTALNTRQSNGERNTSGDVGGIFMKRFTHSLQDESFQAGLSPEIP